MGMVGQDIREEVVVDDRFCVFLVEEEVVVMYCGYM